MDNKSIISTLEKANRVIEDFMPNIGTCVLQNYGELNEVLCEIPRLIKELKKK